MPVVRIQIDICPRCKADVSRRFGLIKTPIIACPNCRHEMGVTAKAVMNNWQFNFTVVAFLVLLGGGLLLIFSSPQATAQFTREFNISELNSPTQETLALVTVAGIFALFACMPFAAIGRAAGYFTARQLLSGNVPPEPTPPAGNAPQQPFSLQLQQGNQKLRTQQYFSGPAPGAYGLTVQPTATVPPPAAAPETRGDGAFRFLVRAFFGLVWAAAFFVVGVFVSAIVATAGISDPEQQAEASRHAGETWGVWVLLGSIGLAVLLSWLGVLPGTRRKKRQPAEA